MPTPKALDSLRSALADIIAITQRALVNFGDHECAQRSAALSNYALFAMFPLMLLAISSVGFMLEVGFEYLYAPPFGTERRLEYRLTPRP